MKTLVYDQQVKGEGFRTRCAITVFTIEGYAKQYNEDPAEAVEKTLAKMKLFPGMGHCLATTIQAAAVITDNYAGKAADLKAKADAYAAAVTLANGEHVMIEGREYITLLVGERYSDPIHFQPVKAHTFGCTKSKALGGPGTPGACGCETHPNAYAEVA